MYTSIICITLNGDMPFISAMGVDRQITIVINLNPSSHIRTKEKVKARAHTLAT